MSARVCDPQEWMSDADCAGVTQTPCNPRGPEASQVRDWEGPNDVGLDLPVTCTRARVSP